MTTRRLVIDSNEPGQFFLLVEGGTVTVGGTHKHADTVLQDLRVTRIRCELEVEGDHVAVRNDRTGDDSGGTQELRPGEALDASGSHLCLEAAPGDEPALEDPGLMPTDAPFAPATNGSAPHEGLARRFVVIDGADQGRFFPLPEAGSVAIGSSRKHADIVLHDLYVARIHCLVEVEGDRVVVADQEGSSGTLLDGQKITRQEVPLGHVVRVGNSHLRLEVGAAPEQPAPGPAGGDDQGAAVRVAGASLEQKESGEEVAGEGEPIEDEIVGEGEPIDEEVVGEGEPIDEEGEWEPVAEAGSASARLLDLWRDKLGQLAGQTVGHYRLGALLGRGRCGVVFRADDTKTGQVVALKVFSPQFPHDDQELQRFARVIRGMLPLRHPNLVTLYGAGKSGTYTWVAREYVEGENLAEVIQRLAETSRPNPRRACRVALHVGRALAFARRHHLRHGKITPANILVQKADKTTKLADLMMGDALDGSRIGRAAQERRPPVELAYLSPEQADPKAFVDELSDLYGLGAVMYALLTGRPPFDGDTADEILDQVRGNTKAARPSGSNNTVPVALDRLVLKLLAKNQANRYQTPTELLADLEPIAEEQGVEV